MIRIGFIGCVQSSLLALETLLTITQVEVVGAATKSASSINSDFVDIVPLCEKHDIPVMLVDKNHQELEDFFTNCQPDVIYCFGWSHILRSPILNLAPLGVIGFHPAQLPANRGRHPIIWALALGLSKTASTFFKMDEGADTGPILSQVEINITTDDDAFSLYKKIMDVAQRQIIEFTLALNDGRACFVEQDESRANNWRKRGKSDGLIDWRMPADSVHNLIRALVPPYPGAEFIWNEKPIKVYKSSICLNPASDNIEPGKVIELREDRIRVKCASKSSIWLEELVLDQPIKIGDYL